MLILNFKFFDLFAILNYFRKNNGTEWNVEQVDIKELSEKNLHNIRKK